MAFLSEKWTEITDAVDELSTDEEKQTYLLDKAEMNQRAAYLTKIGTNSEKLLRRNGDKLDKVIPEVIDPSNKSQGFLISDILAMQVRHSQMELLNLTDLSDALKAEYLNLTQVKEEVRVLQRWSGIC